MKGLGALSVRQPVLAIVLSILVLIIGALAYLRLPVAEYPPIDVPTVVVQTQYAGASAQTVADTVAAPIEQEVNGVENMLYMYSQSTSDGRMRLEVNFRLGTDPDLAQVLVQNRVAIASPRLPDEVRRLGVTTLKDSPNLLMLVFLTSPDDSYDQLYISNYALRRVRDVLLRLPGIGSVEMFGARDYSMRLWLDPDRMAEWGIAAGDVVEAVRAQNVQIAGGQLAEPPIADQAFQPNLTFVGRLERPEQFGEIIVRATPEGRVLRLRDIARIELGAFTYTTNSFHDRKPAVSIAINQRPGSNALATAAGIRRAMAEIAQDFPPGLAYQIAYDPTRFIAQSVHELTNTIRDAVLLVILVVLAFLQRWRSTVIPILAIPVSLVGTFAVMSALGFSVNNLTLFGLVLAVGIVVDDAIVVVENMERHLAAGMNARLAAVTTMTEVGGALVSVALVLAAVFIPTAFLPGISGRFFRQFAVTIAVATAISAFCSLTLSPALGSLILRPHRHGAAPARNPLWRALTGAFGAFNRGFDWLSEAYGRLIGRVLRWQLAMLVVYGGLIGFAGWLLVVTPKGFIPDQDRGYAIVVVQLPGGASLARTTEVARKVEEIILATPGIRDTSVLAGFNGLTSTFSPSAAVLYPNFNPFPERVARGLSGDHIMASLRERLAEVQEASVVVVSPPTVPGIGTGGGFAMRLEDRGGRGTQVLAQAAQDLVATAGREPGLTQVYTPFNASAPQLFVDIDRTRAEMLGVPAAAVTDALETYFGGTYVNDFNAIGRPYRVIAQADLAFRRVEEDLRRLRARNVEGRMVPIGTVIRVRQSAGPDRMPRYNLYPAAEVNGDTLPDVSAATALSAMERLARQVLPDGIGYEWTDLSYQQKQEGSAGFLIFPLCVLFVYLVLAAQYGSWSLPFAVILIVPMCLFAATVGVRIMHLDINILTQIGFVVLVGLAAKNAILIVEFARQLEGHGKNAVEAVMEACRLRLRPILMTSLAFILGVLPLVIAHGAGAEMRRAVGVAVFFGMLGVTAFGLLFTPVFYVVVRRLAEGRRRVAAPPAGAPAPAE
ncbi:MAG TPA: multidrug efflux RND transporter permease subunit [Crenalkalicoccus sp.]|nr:multidrug efflux RND transporter permease subunit [Crenalkalicoccus sp.]